MQALREHCGQVPQNCRSGGPCNCPAPGKDEGRSCGQCRGRWACDRATARCRPRQDGVEWRSHCCGISWQCSGILWDWQWFIGSRLLTSWNGWMRWTRLCGRGMRRRPGPCLGGIGEFGGRDSGQLTDELEHKVTVPARLRFPPCSSHFTTFSLRRVFPSDRVPGRCLQLGRRRPRAQPV